MPDGQQTFGAILCADWAKEPRGRAVYVALPRARAIERVADAAWTFEQLIERSRRYSLDGGVLIAVDAPVGLPESFAPDRSEDVEFTQWLGRAVESPDFFLPCAEPGDWSPRRPFFAVEGSEGGYTRWVDRMREQGVDPLRRIDRSTGAKSMFVLSGIPGAVGHSTRDIWKAILRNRRRVSVWPFDGPLNELVDSERPTLAEIYPRVVYGIALSDQPVDHRHRLAISKNDRACRRAALDALAQQAWVRKFEVEIRDRDDALENGDDFDALMSAAALLRCRLEGTPFESAHMHPVEGGMVGSLSLNIHLQETRFPCGAAIGQERGERTARHLQPPKPPKIRPRPCPIPGCPHVFQSGRGGWDAHVASLKTHLKWHSGVVDPEERKRIFRQEFPEFFQG